MDAGSSPECRTGSALETGRAARIATLKSNLTALAAHPYTPMAGNQLRHNTERAHVILAIGGNAAAAEALVTYTFNAIQPNGSIPNSTDNNTIVFAMAPVGPILLRYGSSLSAAFLQSAPAAIAKGIAGLHAYPVGPDYTNIFLLKATDLLLLGEAIGDRTIEQEGASALGTWLTFTKTNRAGIQEYDSPDYTSVQMGALQEAYANTTNQSAKALVAKILDYYWYDIAGNYFAPNAIFSGPHSRDYDVLMNDTLDPEYFAEGLGGGAGATGAHDPGGNAVPFVESDYLPPSCALALSQVPERIVRARFGLGTAATRSNHPGMDRSNYVTADFSIGSTGAFVGSGQERLIAAAFATTKNLTTIGVNFADNPYIHGTSGFTVNPKDGAYFTSVQDHGNVLAMYDLAGKANVGNVLIPLGVDATYIDANQVALGGQTLTTQSVVALREGNAAFAIRVFAFDGMPPRVEVGMDGAGRVVIPSQRAAFLLRAARVDATTFATFVSDTAAASATTTSLDAGVAWQVAATIGSLTLEAALGPEPTGRKVNGVDATVTEILSVNGVDYAGVLP